MPDFVNRTEELSRLRELYDSGNAELAVIYGRRRLGKTELALLLGFRLEASKSGVEYRRGMPNSSESATV